MKILLNKFSALALISSLGLTSCITNNPVADAGIVGGITGVTSGAIARHAGASSGEAALIGTAVGVTTAVIVYNYQKRKATEQEQAKARQRATAYKKSSKKPKTRYVAVPAKGSDTVMLYDTKNDKVSGQAYDLEKTPKRGEVVKFGSTNAEYVGT